MRRSNRNHHIVARLRVYHRFVLAGLIWIRNVKANHALSDVECFIVHFVPMWWWSGCSWWEYELCYAQSVVYQCVSVMLVVYY